MKRFILMASTAFALTAGGMVSAQALPSLPQQAPSVEQSSNLHQATFYRWWGRDEWRGRRHYRGRRWRDRY